MLHNDVGTSTINRILINFGYIRMVEINQFLEVFYKDLDMIIIKYLEINNFQHFHFSGEIMNYILKFTQLSFA